MNWGFPVLHMSKARIHGEFFSMPNDTRGISGQLEILRECLNVSAHKTTGSHTKVWMPFWHIPQKDLQNTVGEICLKCFLFFWIGHTEESWKMPNCTNTWGCQIATIVLLIIWKTPNHKKAQPKDDASFKCPVVLCPLGKENNQNCEKHFEVHLLDQNPKPPKNKQSEILRSRAAKTRRTTRIVKNRDHFLVVLHLLWISLMRIKSCVLVAMHFVCDEYAYSIPGPYATLVP